MSWWDRASLTARILKALGVFLGGAAFWGIIGPLLR
jgi:hypothetical protein